MALETRTYETILITKVDQPQEGLDALIEKCKGILTGEGKGEILMCDDWAKAKISYPIAKEPRGRWTYLRFKSLPKGIDEMHRNLKINENVLRNFTTLASEDAAEYAPLRENMAKELADRERNRDWKDDRPRRGGFKGKRSFGGPGGGSGGGSRGGFRKDGPSGPSSRPPRDFSKSENTGSSDSQGSSND